MTAEPATKTDEQQIRDLVATWLRASAAGDLATVLGLMVEDVVFLVAGQPPMRGRDAFAAGFRAMEGKFRMHGKSDVLEVQVSGELAYCWTQLEVTVTPVPNGTAIRRSGYTLSVLRKMPEGSWMLIRDANMLTIEN